MKVWLQTKGRAVLTQGSRVKICGLVYIVASAEAPDELDDETAVTACDVQPADAGGKTVTNAELVIARSDHVGIR